MSALLTAGLTSKYLRVQLHQCFMLYLDSTSEVNLLIATIFHTLCCGVLSVCTLDSFWMKAKPGNDLQRTIKCAPTANGHSDHRSRLELVQNKSPKCGCQVLCTSCFAPLSCSYWAVMSDVDIALDPLYSQWKEMGRVWVIWLLLHICFRMR